MFSMIALYKELDNLDEGLKRANERVKQSPLIVYQAGDEDK
jgi:hypothetical protein